MSYERDNRTDELVSGLPALAISLIEEPTAEELERRQRLAARARELRQAIRAESGPLPVSNMRPVKLIGFPSRNKG